MCVERQQLVSANLSRVFEVANNFSSRIGSCRQRMSVA
jgi:hypothetical protein